jgi:hypothetical protein
MPLTHEQARFNEKKKSFKLSQVLSEHNQEQKRGNFEVYADGVGPNLEVSAGVKGTSRKTEIAKKARTWFRKSSCWTIVHPLLPTAMADMVGVHPNDVDLAVLSADLGEYKWTDNGTYPYPYPTQSI